MVRLSLVVILIVLSCISQTDACCCCGDGGGSSSGGKHGSSLTGMIMGFLLARMSTGNAALAEKYRTALLLQQYPTNPMEMLVARANPLSLGRLRALRRENGFGFLWGAKRARKLRHIAEEISKKKHLHGWPFASSKKSAKDTTNSTSLAAIPAETKKRLKSKVSVMDTQILKGHAPESMFHHGPLRLGRGS